MWRALLPLADGSPAGAAPERLLLTSLGVGGKERREAGQIWKGFTTADRSTADSTDTVLLQYQFIFSFW